jgi:hypothetical protein
MGSTKSDVGGWRGAISGVDSKCEGASNLVSTLQCCKNDDAEGLISFCFQFVHLCSSWTRTFGRMFSLLAGWRSRSTVAVCVSATSIKWDSKRRSNFALSPTEAIRRARATASSRHHLLAPPLAPTTSPSLPSGNGKQKEARTTGRRGEDHRKEMRS